MAIWVVRAGKQGEHEDKFLTDRRIFLTWDALSQDLSGIRDRDSIRMVLRQAYPERPENVLGIWTGEVYAFVNAIEPGDLVVTPRRGKASVSVGVVEGPYQYDVAASQPYWHARAVNWIAEIPRTTLDTDLLYSFSAQLTIYQPRAEDAERRMRALLASGQQESTDEETDLVDLEGSVLKLVEK